MQRLLIVIFSVFLAQAFSVPIEVSVAVENEEIFPRLVTEPAWVTELLGPTETPITTKRPTTVDRIRHTITNGIKQVQSSISGIPSTINQLFMGIQQGAQNIIGGGGRPAQKPLESTVVVASPIAPTVAKVANAPVAQVIPSPTAVKAWPQRVIVVKTS